MQPTRTREPRRRELDRATPGTVTALVIVAFLIMLAVIALPVVLHLWGL
jgi:hypothetical protein